jgi:hypothetical protein
MRRFCHNNRKSNANRTLTFSDWPKKAGVCSTSTQSDGERSVGEAKLGILIANTYGKSAGHRAESAPSTLTVLHVTTSLQPHFVSLRIRQITK